MPGASAIMSSSYGASPYATAAAELKPSVTPLSSATPELIQPIVHAAPAAVPSARAASMSTDEETPPVSRLAAPLDGAKAGAVGPGRRPTRHLDGSRTQMGRDRRRSCSRCRSIPSSRLARCRLTSTLLPTQRQDCKDSFPPPLHPTYKLYFYVFPLSDIAQHASPHCNRHTRLTDPRILDGTAPFTHMRPSLAGKKRQTDRSHWLRPDCNDSLESRALDNSNRKADIMWFCV